MTTANAHAALPLHQELFFTCILSLNPYNHPMREVLLLSLFFFLISEVSRVQTTHSSLQSWMVAEPGFKLSQSGPQSMFSPLSHAA